MGTIKIEQVFTLLENNLVDITVVKYLYDKVSNLNNKQYEVSFVNLTNYGLTFDILTRKSLISKIWLITMTYHFNQSAFELGTKDGFQLKHCHFNLAKIIDKAPIYNELDEIAEKKIWQAERGY